jgi:hypothetical protein
LPRRCGKGRAQSRCRCGRGWAQSWRRCGRGGPSPGADVASSVTGAGSSPDGSMVGPNVAWSHATLANTRCNGQRGDVLRYEEGMCSGGAEGEGPEGRGGEGGEGREDEGSGGTGSGGKEKRGEWSMLSHGERAAPPQAVRAGTRDSRSASRATAAGSRLAPAWRYQGAICITARAVPSTRAVLIEAGSRRRVEARCLEQTSRCLN